MLINLLRKLVILDILFFVMGKGIASMEGAENSYLRQKSLFAIWTGHCIRAV